MPAPTDRAAMAAAMAALFDSREDAEAVALVLDQQATNALQQVILYNDDDTRRAQERLEALAAKIRANLDLMES